MAGIIIDNMGNSNYTAVPTISFTGGGGSGASAAAFVSDHQIISVVLDTYGAGYTSVPTVAFSGGGGAPHAVGAAFLALGTDKAATWRCRPDVRRQRLHLGSHSHNQGRGQRLRRPPRLTATYSAIR